MMAAKPRTIMLLAGLAPVVVTVAVGLSWNRIYYAIWPEARFWGRWEVVERDLSAVLSSDSALPGGAVEPLVEAVDEAQGLVVLSKGQDHAVTLGDEFQVFRGEKSVTRIRVIRVYDDLSGANVIEGSGDQIRVGDAGSRVLIAEFTRDGSLLIDDDRQWIYHVDQAAIRFSGPSEAVAGYHYEDDVITLDLMGKAGAKVPRAVTLHRLPDTEDTAP